MKISQKSIRNFIVLSCIVLVLFLAGCFIKPAVTPSLPEQPTFTHYRVVTQAYKDFNPAHSIEIAWRANSIDYSFKIFKSVNGGSFEELFDDGVDQLSYYQRKSCSCSFTDIQVQPGNQYGYYVLAYDEKEEIGRTETFSREIFLPPCTLTEPRDNAVVDTPIPTFSWNNQELTKYLTKSKAEGYLKTHLKVNNETIQEEVWNMTFEDTTVDNVTYNLDNTGEPLVNDNEYEWFHWTDAYDAEGNLIANAYSNSWHFHYKGPIKAVLMGKIMVPQTTKSISKEITGMIPLADATITITDSEGITHTCITQAQGQYIFPQVAPGTNYIVTATGIVDGYPVVYKDIVPSIELHEVFDAGVADAESTALALVMEAMLDNDPNLKPEDIVLDDILTAENFSALVSTVDGVLNTYGYVTEDPGVIDAVETVEEELLFFANFEARSHIHRGLNDELGHYIHLLWKPYPDANSYQIYKKVGSSVYTIVNLEISYDEGMNRYEAWDDDISPETVYGYYIEAVTLSGPASCPPEIVDTWLPATAPVSPEMHSYATNPNPTFQWESLGISTYPYHDCIWSGDVELHVTDETIGEDVWEIEINGLDVSSVAYNDPRAEESAIPLIEGHKYSWFVIFDGNDGPDFSGKEIANSSCRSIFYYDNQIIFGHTISFVQKFADSVEYSVSLQWIGYPAVSEYHVYRSTDSSTGFIPISGELEFDEENQITFKDYNEIDYGVTYYYYVIADLLGGGTVLSPTITIDTWFPSFDLTYPGHNAVITESNPTFTWQNPGITIPYDPSVYQNGGVHFYVWDETDNKDVWEVRIELDIDSITYDGDPLREGHKYIWGIRYEGDNANGFEVANSCSESWFYYGNQVPDFHGTTLVDKYGDNSPEYKVRLWWREFPGATSYHVYRSTGTTANFGEVSGELGYDEGDGRYRFRDENLTHGTTYQYYVIAELSTGVFTDPGRIITLDSWFSDFNITNPAHGSILTDNGSSLVLNWSKPTILTPNSVANGDINIDFYDETDNIRIWEYTIENLTDTSITYTGDLLLEGHEYSLHICYDGNNADGEEIANSSLEVAFYYGSKPLEVRASTYTGMHENYFVEINWTSVGDNYNYVIYRSEDSGSSFGPLSNDYEITDGYFPYYFLDNTVTVNTRYDYKIIALDDVGGEISSEVVTVDTWLPACESFTPVDRAVIPVDSVQVFSWTFPQGFDFPYNGKIDFEDSHFWIYDKISGQEVYYTYEDGEWRDSITYNCSNLTSGNEYGWHFEFWGTDSEWNTAAGSGLGGSFYYGYQPFEVEVFTVTDQDEGYIAHRMRLRWEEYPGAEDYIIYKSINGESYNVLAINYQEEGGEYEVTDNDVEEGNSYSYYIVAYNNINQEIARSDVKTRGTWLPPCSCSNPPDYFEVIESGQTYNPVDDPNQLFTWDPVGISSSYGSIISGDSGFHIHDHTYGQNELYWRYEFDDMTTASVIYNQDGQAPDLIPGHFYRWNVWAQGYDENEELIAEVDDKGYYFYYQEIPWEYRCTAHSGPGHIHAEFYWDELPEADHYNLSKSTDGESFSNMNANYEWTENNNEYNFWDEAVNEVEAPYYYKIEAYDASNALIQTSDVMIVDTWLPAMIADTPINDERVTGNIITFSWHDENTIITFPYNVEYEFQGAGFLLRNATTNERIFEDHWDNYITKSIIYDNLPLVEGNQYIWDHYICGGNDSRTSLASTTSGSFYYGSKPWEYRCTAHSGPGHIHAELYWDGLPEASSYKVLKSIDGTNFAQIDGDHGPFGDSYNFNDNDVIEGTTYYYKIQAYGASNNLIQTSDDLIINTWLPAMITDYPINDDIVIVNTENTITFSWHDETTFAFPYKVEYEFQDAGFILRDTSTNEEIFSDHLGDYSIKSITYENLPLVEGNRYEWHHYICGGNNNKTDLVSNTGGSFYFGEAGKVNGVEAIAFTNCFDEENQYHRQIWVQWLSYPEAISYHIYKRTNETGNFLEIFGEYHQNSERWEFRDEPVEEGNIYDYYVTAETAGGETLASEIRRVDSNSWYTPYPIVSPAPGSIVTDSMPVLEWSHLGVPDLPYNSIYEGQTHIHVYDHDRTNNEEMWGFHPESIQVTSVVYNQNNEGKPLQPGHSYDWNVIFDGFDDQGKQINVSMSWSSFYYGYQPFGVEAIALTGEGGYQNIEVRWDAYPGAANYKIFKSVNEGSYGEIIGGYNEGDYHFMDDDIDPVNAYTYRITACDTNGVEIVTSDTVTIDTWLPNCSLTTPAEGEVVLVPNPIFEWVPMQVATYPDSPFYFVDSSFRVFDETTGEKVMEINVLDISTSTVTYSGTPLVSGHRYSWRLPVFGKDENGKPIAESNNESYFYYGEINLEIGGWTITKVHPWCIVNLGMENISGRSIYINWPSIFGAQEYKVYREINGSGQLETIYIGEGYNCQLGEAEYSKGWFDFDVIEGNSYTYQVSYIIDGTESEKSNSMTRSIWLPECSLSDPLNFNPENPSENAVLDPCQLLQWNPVGISDYPYQDKIYSGTSEIWVCYYDTPIPVIDHATGIWNESFDNLTTTSTNFDPNAAVEPLVPGSDHCYAWETRGIGYDEYGNKIAESWSGARHFYYMGPE